MRWFPSFKYKYGVSGIIDHPQGTYKVAFLDKRRVLSNSKLLWFKDKFGRYMEVD